MVAAEASRVRDAINRPDHGVYIVIDRGAGRIAEERVRVEPREWAKERFSDFKGCRGIFPRLRNDQERLKLINQLRAIAKEKLAGEEAKIPSATQALCSLAPLERGKIFARLLKRSMPWYPAQFDRFKPKGDRFTMIIAAPESTAPQYRPVLDELIATNLPGFGIEPTIEDSSSRGKIICYCELSGMPLNSVQPLRDEWRKSYTKQENTRGRLPLHNHRDYLRFPNPIVPSPGEIAQLRQKITLFLKGVLYGVLRRSLRSETGEDLRYYLDMSHNDYQSVGTERKIRARDFNAIHESAIARKVRRNRSALLGIAMGCCVGAGEVDRLSSLHPDSRDRRGDRSGAGISRAGLPGRGRACRGTEAAREGLPRRQDSAAAGRRAAAEAPGAGRGVHDSRSAQPRRCRRVGGRQGADGGRVPRHRQAPASTPTSSPTRI